MFVSALPDPTCNSEKSANGGNKQILLLLLYKSLLFRQVGPRSKVWTEKEMLEISAWEFAEVSPFALWTL